MTQFLYMESIENNYIKEFDAVVTKNKKNYIINLGVKSDVIASILEKVADIVVALRLLGHNKAIVLARKK